MVLKAGIPAESLRNTATGVWCGSFVRGIFSPEKVSPDHRLEFLTSGYPDYEQPLMRDPDTTPPHAATGTGIAILANRVSHVFDLAGTSQTIDTGCSASMICIHQACRSLASGESSLVSRLSPLGKTSSPCRPLTRTYRASPLASASSSPPIRWCPWRTLAYLAPTGGASPLMSGRMVTAAAKAWESSS